KLDLAVGFSDVAAIGDRVGKERPLAVAHARLPEQAAGAAEALRTATTISAERTSPPPIVRETLVTA
ncbi:MAG TPA: hypothetical protein VGN43_05660, partial [Steroidobacteraceae bacterium]|nr:hypothetical protein [Steroidobacteraceae bacterium]